MVRTRIVSFGIAAMLACASQASGQSLDQLTGHRVRLLGLTGTLLGATPDSLTFLQDTQTAPIRIARARVTHVDVSTGRHRQVLKGTLIGAGVGALATAWFLHGFCGADSPCQEDEFVVAVVIIGLPPVAVGAGIGALVRVEHWKPALSMAPPARRLELGLTIPF